MLSGGAEADDGEDSADGGTVQFSLYQKNRQSCCHAVYTHIEHDRLSAHIPQIIRSSDTCRAEDLPVFLERIQRMSRQADADHAAEQNSQDSGKQLIVPGGPDESGIGQNVKGLQQGYQHGGNDAGRKSHVVKGISEMRIMDMGRDGGQNKTDKNADGNGYDDTERIG